MEEPKKTDFEKEIKQSKQLPRFRYKLGLSEQKMLLAFFGQLTQSADTFQPETMTITDIGKYCGFEDNNTYRVVQTCARNLSKESLEYYNGKNYSFVPWFRFIRYQNGIISYQLNDAIKSELLQLYKNDKIYVTIDPRILPNFKSNYGLRFYLILKGELASHKHEVCYSTEEICYMLYLSAAYDPKHNNTAAGNQRIKIISPAVEEINQVSNINVSYEPIKQARKIIGWKFTINYKTESTMVEQPSNQKTIKAVTNTKKWYEDEQVQNATKDLISRGVYNTAISKFYNKFNNKDDFMTAYKAALQDLGTNTAKEPGAVLYNSLMEYKPELTNLFNNIDQAKKAEEPETIINGLETFEEILFQAGIQKDKKITIKILQWAKNYKPKLLKEFQTKYKEIKGNDFDIDMFIAMIKLYGVDEAYKDIDF